ncbi:hypothetical protein BUALT_Bualt05G0127800 [Buddleja alternifolia]|uniref:Uncharacterized protein n=1 Tax=Buddleja alternifolia TaxID=168488 RepID=A0AAV6XUH8_9LAMI|nr:hypothetical protein BUALT_Bualt05G0127800 [Buddleja alternifolia]
MPLRPSSIALLSSSMLESRVGTISFVFSLCCDRKVGKMNHCAIQKNSFAACEEMMGGAAVGCRSEMRETVVCPKPRRLGLIHATLNEPSYVRPLRWHASHHQDVCDAKAGNELLDIILAKGGGCGADQSATPIASSPPFFSGSPPSRVSNPLIQDARFGNDEFTPVSPRAIPTPSGLAPSPSSTRKGGCVRANFGNNPAVRVEGFDCLDRDRRNCSIPTLA